MKIKSAHLAIGALLLPVALTAQQPLETETARLPHRGAYLVALTYEAQTSPDGTETALPFAIEYGLSDRLAFLIEPVFYTSIRPKSGAMRTATGAGDLEATLQYLFRAEGRKAPALAFAAEVKFPTAKDPLIGTRRADFTPYLIASKRYGRYDVHGNIGYSFVGRPPGVSVQNTVNLALGVENHVTPRFDLIAEALETTAAAAGEGTGEGSLTSPEIAGSETVGMVGVRYRAQRGFWLSFGMTYDNTKAVLFRPGLTFELP
jgi:outer membrane putative beta-barrel porin/alpha-amylase